jgi:hypothetical protein
MEETRTMNRRNAVSLASLFVLFALSGIATADEKFTDEMYVKVAVPLANKALDDVLPRRPVQGPNAKPGCRSQDCKWPKHTGAWVDPSKAQVKDKKGAAGSKFVYWTGKTSEDIEYEVTIDLFFGPKKGGYAATTWGAKVKFNGDVGGRADMAAIPGPND